MAGKRQAMSNYLDKWNEFITEEDDVRDTYDDEVEKRNEKSRKQGAEKMGLEERCQKGWKTHPTRKTKKMYGKTYRNCIKAEGEELEEKKDDRCTRIAKRKYDVWPSAYASGAVVRCRQGKIWKGVSESRLREIIEEELESFLKEKEGLHKWFSRQGGKGKSKGWVDCNTCRKDKKTGKKTCKSCGRKEGEKRAKYPSCRPTPAACDSKGKGKKWGKKK